MTTLTAVLLGIADIHPKCGPAEFWIGAIEIFAVARGARRCLMKSDHKVKGELPMKSEFPFSPTPGKKEEVSAPPPSRFIDEKISDESGTETKADSAMAPAGLKNPFWN
jgi:hypothetical protein